MNPPPGQQTAGPGALVRLVAADTDGMRLAGGVLATVLRAGDLVLLSGPLGAGKTTFAQGIGIGLGVAGHVTSPTFVIARVHGGASGGPALVHVDAYRVGDRLEIDDLDLDAFVPDSVTVVEWGEGKVEGLAPDRLTVRIERPPAESEPAPRLLSIEGTGPRWERADLAALPWPTST